MARETKRGRQETPRQVTRLSFELCLREVWLRKVWYREDFDARYLKKCHGIQWVRVNGLSTFLHILAPRGGGDTCKPNLAVLRHGRGWLSKKPHGIRHLESRALAGRLLPLNPRFRHSCVGRPTKSPPCGWCWGSQQSRFSATALGQTWRPSY